MSHNIIAESELEVFQFTTAVSRKSAHPLKFKISIFYASLYPFHKSAHPIKYFSQLKRPWADLNEITVYCLKYISIFFT